MTLPRHHHLRENAVLWEKELRFCIISRILHTLQFWANNKHITEKRKLLCGKRSSLLKVRDNDVSSREVVSRQSVVCVSRVVDVFVHDVRGSFRLSVRSHSDLPDRAVLSEGVVHGVCGDVEGEVAHVEYARHLGGQAQATSIVTRRHGHEHARRKINPRGGETSYKYGGGAGGNISMCPPRNPSLEIITTLTIPPSSFSFLLASFG